MPQMAELSPSSLDNPPSPRASRADLREVGSPGTQFRHGLAPPLPPHREPGAGLGVRVSLWTRQPPRGSQEESGARFVGPEQDELQSPLFQNQEEALLLGLKYELFLSFMVSLDLPWAFSSAILCM